MVHLKERKYYLIGRASFILHSHFAVTFLLIFLLFYKMNTKDVQILQRSASFTY